MRKLFPQQNNDFDNDSESNSNKVINDYLMRQIANDAITRDVTTRIKAKEISSGNDLLENKFYGNKNRLFENHIKME